MSRYAHSVACHCTVSQVCQSRQHSMPHNMPEVCQGTQHVMPHCTVLQVCQGTQCNIPHCSVSQVCQGTQYNMPQCTVSQVWEHTQHVVPHFTVSCLTVSQVCQVHSMLCHVLHFPRYVMARLIYTGFQPIILFCVPYIHVFICWLVRISAAESHNGLIEIVA